MTPTFVALLCLAVLFVVAVYLLVDGVFKLAVTWLRVRTWTQPRRDLYPRRCADAQRGR